jgi:hypothetical protein
VAQVVALVVADHQQEAALLVLHTELVAQAAFQQQPPVAHTPAAVVGVVELVVLM